ncbi:MAG: T9SS type A sorting domain-containing protein [Lentimicrobiaceae bacterium]|nr:T9SS type A sorting domain-containing protein [Lentimicrobiaceae bacterium]
MTALSALTAIPGSFRFRILFFIALLLISLAVAGQSRARIPQEWQNQGVRVPLSCDNPARQLDHAGDAFESIHQPDIISEYITGTTFYDLQTNKSNQNRFYRYPDGTMAATWMYSTDYPNFVNRGTGYNYFNGTSWGAAPTVRIENIKVGWPSYAPLGTGGEIVVSHIGSTGLNISTRAVRGTGTWAHTSLAGPTSNPNLLWPRMITSGITHSNIHIMALTAPIANAGTLYNGSDGALLYYRSTNGGLSWDISGVQPPGTDTSAYLGLSGDCYAWAEPRGNTLAFVVGDSWFDLFLLKSTNNGTSWTKTMIWQHPYPFFNRTTPTVTDTFYCPDGSVAAAIDNNGKVHVFFGINRAYANTAGSYWFPLVDGLGYWNEDMPQITSSFVKNTLHPDTLENHGQLAGYALDVNNNGSLDISTVGYYYVSLSGMPTATIDSNNIIYLVYSSVMENLTNGVQHYRHLLGRKSIDMGYSWGNILDLTAAPIHSAHECVFPSMAAFSDNKLHLLYQQDMEPGLAVRGDLDPYANNNIVYLNVDKTDLVHVPPGPLWTYTITPHMHKIVLPPLSGMLVNNVAINNGDYVGAFYQSSTGLACAGYKKIFSASDTLTAYGAMPGQGNGFAAGEVIKWRIWKESTSTAYQAFAVYDPQAPQQGNFAAGGLSKVMQLKGGLVEVLASPGPSVCSGTPVNMQIIVSGGYPPYTYAWSPSTWLSNPAIANPVATPLSTTTYTITVTDIIGITGTASSTIQIIPPPAVSLGPLANACDDWPPFMLSGGIPGGGTYAGNYVTGGMFNPTAAGQGNHMIIYSITDPQTGCIGKDTSYILVEHCVGMDPANTRPQWQLYPNPFSDYIHFRGFIPGDAEVAVSIHHSDGRMVGAEKLTTARLTCEGIQVSGLAKGLYIVRIVIQDTEAVFRVVKTGY